MKRQGILAFVVCLIALGISPDTVLAQGNGFNFYSLTVSSGEDTISSGITGIVEFTDKKDHLIQVAVQQEQAWFLYGKKFKVGKSTELFLAGSVGHHQAAPWAGPLVSVTQPLSKAVTVSGFYWPGVYLWEPKDWKNDAVVNPERVFAGHLGSVRLDVGPLGLTYTAQNFLNEPPNYLPGVSYTHSVNKKFKTTGSATWNGNAEKWMFYIGLTWSPEHN